jgi:UDP-N-acetylglucosamine 2-epimerase
MMSAKPTICCIVGTRPDAIKMAPVIHRLGLLGDRVDRRVVSIAQHRAMLDQVLRVFEIKPDVDLDIMQPRQSLSSVTEAILRGIDPVLDDQKPDLTIVQGDTTASMAAALASFYHKIPVGHVEAGMRSGSLAEPYPEEMNRRFIDSVSALHFAATDRNRENLLAEGTDSSSIFVTGNTVVDALHWAADKADPGFVESLGINGRFILATAHRRESWGRPLADICGGLADILENCDDVSVVFAAHLNPIVRDAAKAALGGHERAPVIDPPDYLSFLALLKGCYFVMTDSGGIQEEAPAFGKPVLVLRNRTERVEGIEAGSARLVGTGREAIVDAALKLLSDESEYDKMARVRNPYGDGHAAERIIQAILGRFEIP